MTRLGTLPLLLAAAPAAALSMSFVPQDQTVGVGATVDVDVVVSGLHAETPDEIVSAFDLLVGFDPLVLSATGVTFGSELRALRLTLSAGTGSVTVVPEPSTLALLLLSGAVLLRLRRAPGRR